MNYINGLRQIWRDLGVNIDQYHADPASVMAKSHWAGGNIGVNGGVTQTDYDNAKKLDPSVFIFGGEIYPGWLTHWGENWAGKTVEDTVKEFTFLCTNNHSFSMYMVHGGSNFGFTAGANDNNAPSDYKAHITSYDYDAPINEQGSVGSKYNALRALFLRFVEWVVPDPPAALKTISVGSFTPTAYATLMDNLPEGIKLSNYTHFESAELKMYNQGMIVYQADIPAGKHSFTLVVHDYAIVWVDGKLIDKFDRQVSKSHTLAFDCSATCNVKILVEAMGHINFGSLINSDRKGLIGFSGNANPVNWVAYKLPLEVEWVTKINTLKAGSYPVFAKATFDVVELGDTFINMSNYGKGYVWVNGRNLGRYWNKGPQQKLFCPGVWLKNKGN
jgi:beta-galactosidase